MFKKQIEELKEKEQETTEMIDALAETLKWQKSTLTRITKARKQLEKMQEEFDVEDVSEQPNISDERIAESNAEGAVEASA